MEAVKVMQHRPGLAGAAQHQAAGCHQSKHNRQSSQMGALVNPCRLFGDGCGWGRGKTKKDMVNSLRRIIYAYSC
jgi:hypothetical protein